MLLSRLVPLAAFLLSCCYPAAAQRQPIYQPIGTEMSDPYTTALAAPLHIVLPTAMSEDKLAKEFKKPADRAAYLADIAAQRVALEAAAKSWHLSPVQLITQADYYRLREDKQASYLALSFGTQAFDNQRSTAYFPALQLEEVGHVQVPGGPFRRFVTTDSRCVAFQVFNPSAKVLLIQRWPYWSSVFHASDLISTVQQLQIFLTQRAQGQLPRAISQQAEEQLGQHAALLMQKTLLLSATQLSTELPESAVRRLYPFPVQLADRAAVEAAAASTDPRYLYLRFVTTHDNRGFQLVEAATGHVLGYADFLAIRPDSFGRVQESDLAELVKTASGKQPR